MDWQTGNLTYLEQSFWKTLAEGAVNRTHAFHTAVVATVSRGGRPQARNVVLRQCLPEARRLRFHTDRRSAKALELSEAPAIQWVFYDAAARIQLRVSGLATLHAGDELARSAWDNTPLYSRRCYLVTRAPGTVVSERSPGLAPHLLACAPGREESELGWPNFLVVDTKVQRVDLLYLRATGNESAYFEYRGEQLGECGWQQA